MSNDREDNLEYIDQLDDEEKRWLRKFNAEYYRGANYGEGEKLITDKEMLKEARKNYNSYKRDAMQVADRSGKLTYLGEKETAFMDEASDNWEWRDVYSLQGRKAAIETIMEQAVRDLDNDLIDKRVTLSRFHVKMDELRRHHNKELALSREIKKNGKT